MEQESGTNEHLRSICFVDVYTGWIVGDDGTILRTEDGGVEWVPLVSGTEEDLFGLWFVDENTGWVGGRNGVLLKTTDGGGSWAVLAPGTSEQIRSIEFLDANLGWVIGGGGMILKTTDGGENWSPQTSGTTTYLESICFVDPDHGWIAGGSGDESLTLKTTDGGDTWLAAPPPEPMVGLSSIYFVNQEIGWLSGYGAIVYKSTDGGDSWLKQYDDSGTSYTSINCVHAINENTCWGVGHIGVEGRGMKTMDGGETWMELLGSGNNYLQSVCFVDQSNGWAVGHYGTILAATSGEWLLGMPTAIHDGPSSSEGAEEAISLIYNYPNPFKAGTTVSYELPRSTRIDLRVFDVSGRLVRVLKDGDMVESGLHQVPWDGRNNLGQAVPAGVYFYRLDVGPSSATKRMLLVR
jgi:photosystem II stability/assembly factor-like uncharacterized protein